MSQSTNSNNQHRKPLYTEYLEDIGLSEEAAIDACGIPLSLARFESFWKSQMTIIGDFAAWYQKLEVEWRCANHYESDLDDCIESLKAAERRDLEQDGWRRETGKSLDPRVATFRQEEYDRSLRRIRNSHVKAAWARAGLEDLKGDFCNRVLVSIKIEVAADLLRSDRDFAAMMQKPIDELTAWQKKERKAMVNRNKFEIFAETAEDLRKTYTGYRPGWYSELQRSGALWQDRLPRYSGPVRQPLPTNDLDSDPRASIYQEEFSLNSSSKPDSPSDSETISSSDPSIHSEFE